MRATNCPRIFATMVLLSCATVTLPRVCAQDQENLGKQAEQAGHLREAVAHYVAALQNSPEGGDANQRLREKIIALALKIRPTLLIPPEAQRYMGRGKAAVETAKAAEDFRRAALEFQNALKAAPWLASAYFNLGVVEEKADQYGDAIRSFKFYLLAAPSATDADEVRTRIGGLEYKLERQKADALAVEEKRKTEEAALAVERRRQEETAEVLVTIKGKVGLSTYSCTICLNNPKRSDGGDCNEQEYKGDNWYELKAPAGSFSFPGDGTVRWNGPWWQLVGTPHGPSIRDIEWKRGSKTIWVHLAENGSWIVESTDRPPNDADFNPTTRYHYTLCQR